MLGTSEAMQRGTAAQLSFLVTSLLSSSTRFADLPGHAVTLRRKDRVEEIFRLLKIWCLTSAALATLLVFQSLHTVSPSEAIKSSRLELAHESVLESHSVASFSSTVHRFVSSFREAPSFRNGKHCFSTLGRGTEWDFVCDPSFVHIAMTLDESYLRGSMAAIYSIIQHASCPENIVFHFLVSSEDSEFHSLIRSVFPLLKYKIYHFNENLVKGRISSSVRQALEQPLNYARNYLASILETCVHRILYLDSDVVVIDDIANLWATSLGSKALGAPEYCHANFTKYFTSSFWSDKRLTRTFVGRFPCYFNTGVMIMDLIKWRHNEYTRTIERWMEIQKERRIYELGSLPPFLLVFAGLVEPMSHRWNQHGLGGDNVKGSCRPLHPGPVSLLHWSGNGKPWLRLDSNEPCPVDSLWAPYDLFIS